MKKLIAVAAIISCSASVYAQQDKKQEKKDARKDRVEALRRQEEEGVLVYNKQTVFGIQLRNTGYGAFVEIGKMQNRDVTSIMQFEFTETKHPKEYKAQRNDGFIFAPNSPFVFGKQNYFYNLRAGMGQSRRIGDKGNKNGVSVQAIYLGGVAIGLLRPYYLEIYENSGDSRTRTIRYDSGNPADDDAFLNIENIAGGTGLGKGWGEIKIKPGVHAKTGLRFDYGRFNELVSALEIGLAGEFYAQKIPILVEKTSNNIPLAKNRQFFFNAYVAIEFGKRK